MSDGYGRGPSFPNNCTPEQMRRYANAGNACGHIFTLLRYGADQLEAQASRLNLLEEILHDARRIMDVPTLKLTLMGSDLVRRTDAALASSPLPSDKAPTISPTDGELQDLWRSAGGEFHGPNVETGTMSEANLLPFLRTFASASNHAEEVRIAYHSRNQAQERANTANRNMEELTEAASAVLPFLERNKPEVMYAVLSIKSEGDKLREQAAKADARDAAVNTLKAVLCKHAYR